MSILHRGILRVNCYVLRLDSWCLEDNVLLFLATVVLKSKNSNWIYLFKDTLLISPRIADQAQRKMNIFSKSKPKKLIILSATFLQHQIWPNQLLDKLKIERPKSNGCYFDDLVLKFEHVKLIIRPIEIKNSA